MTLSLGIDTGGTCTDAVLVNEKQELLASAKTLTTHGHLIKGLVAVTDQLLGDQEARQIGLVSLSTTLATNAVVEGQGRTVALVLVGFSPTWLERARLGEALGSDPVLFIAGGHTAGGVEAATLDLDELRRCVTSDHDRSGVRLCDRIEAWAVSSVFAVRNPRHELEVAACLRKLSGKPVSLGHRLSSGLDAPRRALTALLNARLIPALVELLDATAAMLRQRQIDAPIMVVKGDGTLIAESVARELPVETVLSGPAASVVAAGALGTKSSAVVVDIGGTTSDIAVLEEGLPRLNPHGAEVGGWRTMVQAVDVASVGIGGDSELGVTEAGEIRVGPRRVIPLVMLASHNERIVAQLQSQLERGYSKSHDACFVVALPVGERRPRSVGQRALLERIPADGISLEALFAVRTEALSLKRLETEGFVRRAAFTPTDASHVLGTQTTWPSRAAELGARLWFRQLQDQGASLARDLNTVTAVERRVSEAVCAAVEHASALAIAERVMRAPQVSARHHGERVAWLAEVLRGIQTEAVQSTDRTALGGEVPAPLSLEMTPRIAASLFGLGASAGLYHPGAARLLKMECHIPPEAGVANAYGAVAGVVRQRRSVCLQPGGGHTVVALLPDGPQRFDTLESAVEAAEAVVRGLARTAALAAGAADDDDCLVLSCQRNDTVVEQDGNTAFVESILTAIASGRPASVAET